MNTPPDIPIAKPPPKFSVEAARLLLEQALEAEKSGESTEAEMAHKRAINDFTGASILVPREVIVTAATAVPKP